MRKTYFLTLLSSVLLSGCIALPIIPTGNNSTTSSSDSSNNRTRAAHLEDVEEVCNLALKNESKANKFYIDKYINVKGKFTQKNVPQPSIVGALNKKFNIEVMLPNDLVTNGDFYEGLESESGTLRIKWIKIMHKGSSGKDHCMINTSSRL